MEKRMEGLEERMLILERYIEMRFCESFRDFSNRNKRQHSSKPSRVPDNPSFNREDLIREVLHRLERPNEVNVRKNQSHATSASPPPPESIPEPSATRSSRRIASRKQNGSSSRQPGPASKTRVSSTCTTLPIPHVKLVRVDGPTQSSSSSDPSPAPVIKNPVDSEPEHEEPDDDYFSYAGTPKDPLDVDASSDFNPAEDPPDSDVSHDLNPDSDMEWNSKNPKSSSSSKSKRRPKRPKNLTKIQLTNEKLQSLLNASSVVANADKAEKQCEICKKFWKPAAFDAHMLMHSKERTLKCQFCEKTFFNRGMLNKHERNHELDKYGIQCRVGSCTKLQCSKDRILAHERVCIRRALENGIEVDPEVMEDVRRRSKNEKDLRWPDKPVIKPPKEKGEKVKGRFCAHCKIFIEKGWNEHHRQLHSKWKCPLCPDEADKKFSYRQKLISHMLKCHSLEAAEGIEQEEEGGDEQMDKQVENDEMQMETTLEESGIL